MKAIRHVLTERYDLWEDAYELAGKDKEITLQGGENGVYSPTEDGGVFEDEAPASVEATTTTKPPA